MPSKPVVSTPRPKRKSTVIKDLSPRHGNGEAAGKVTGGASIVPCVRTRLNMQTIIPCIRPGGVG